jgi:hypothetical protein
MRRVLLGKGEVRCGLTVVVACGQRANGFIDSLVNSTKRDHQLIDVSRKSPTVALMPKAVQFDSYGGVDVLEVRDVARPVPQAGEVLVEVRGGRHQSE